MSDPFDGTSSNPRSDDAAKMALAGAVHLAVRGIEDVAEWVSHIEEAVRTLDKPEE